MIDQIFITGLSGALVIMYFFGLGIIIRIFKEHRDTKVSWKNATKNNIRKLSNLALFSFSFIITLIMVFGLIISIIDDVGLI